MKTYAITKNGIARIMRCKDETTAEDEIDKWHPNDKAQVSAIRQIDETDVPSDATRKDAWRDTGNSIDATMQLPPPQVVKDRAEKLAELLVRKNLITTTEADEVKEARQRDR